LDACASGTPPSCAPGSTLDVRRPEWEAIKQTDNQPSCVRHEVFEFRRFDEEVARRFGDRPRTEARFDLGELRSWLAQMVRQIRRTGAAKRSLSDLVGFARLVTARSATRAALATLHCSDSSDSSDTSQGVRTGLSDLWELSGRTGMVK
jgi:hypothetical protein